MKKFYDKLFEFILVFLSSITLIGMLCIFIFIFKEALLPFLSDSLEKESFSISKLLFSGNLFSNPNFEWNPDAKEPTYSLLPLILGSFKITIIALCVAIPLAFFIAIYTSQFVNLKIRFWIKSSLELFSSVPSVVLGFFGLVIFSDILDYFFSFQFRLNGFIAGITLGLAIFPNVYSIYEDFLCKIPKSYKEASYALGATKNQTILKIIIPASIPIFFVASLLGFNRAIGETMIVLMLSGNIPIVSANIFDPVKTLSATIASEMGEVIFGDIHYSILFFLGLILFLFTFLFNLITMILMKKIKKKYILSEDL